ncbi:MAG: ATP-binding cassette domain-containing protein, partial [Candidatus Eremiobacteraeota bacterium]|nr:ATP-binding cassette domain-containing protein [Candidatus Eremiobacteraeota bacterium]
ELVDRLRVWENVVLGREPRRGLQIDVRAARERVRELAASYGLDVDPDATVEGLPVGIAQRVEILRELAREPRVLVLDEPTAVLAPVEIDALFETLRSLAARGTAVLVITHKLQEVVTHAQRVTVMRAGRIVMRALTRDTSIGEIARAMVGGDVPPLAERANTVVQPAFAARNLAAGEGAHALLDASFDVRGGEIVGIAGVEGNGQSALTDAMAGLLPYAGTMSLRGAALEGTTPANRIAAGLRTIPQDRQREALVLDWSIVDNVALGDHASGAMRRGPTLERNVARTLARSIVERFDVRTPSIATHVGTLSGGNQQKVVVGRTLAHSPALVVAYQPTRGIDVGAAALVQSRLIEARNAGAAILLVSFELDEVLAISDRLLVLFRGRIAGEFERGDFDRARIGALMAGAA